MELISTYPNDVMLLECQHAPLCNYNRFLVCVVHFLLQDVTMTATKELALLYMQMNEFSKAQVS